MDFLIVIGIIIFLVVLYITTLYDKYQTKKRQAAFAALPLGVYDAEELRNLSVDCPDAFDKALQAAGITELVDLTQGDAQRIKDEYNNILRELNYRNNNVETNAVLALIRTAK